jgi:protein tyrosine kinase modulator
MELTRILRILLRYWYLVLIPVLITGALAAPALLRRGESAGGFATTIRYSAAQDMTAVPRQTGDNQDVWLGSELTVNALTDWVRSGSFRQEVLTRATALGLPVTDLSALGIAADNERSLGQLILSWPDATQLATIAQAAVDVLQTRTALYFPQLGGAPASVSILEAPAISPAPPPLTDRYGPLLRVGLGLLAGIGLAFLAHYFDPMLRRREDVEALGLPVVGTIPKK